MLTPNASSVIQLENGNIDCPFKNVVGVYIGWRGKAFNSNIFNILNNVTFWNRKATTRNVASASVVSMLLDLSTTLRQGDISRLRGKGGGDNASVLREVSEYESCTYAQYIKSNEICSRSIVIGHSFGGRVLETAVSQALIGSRFLASQVGIDEFVAQTTDDATNLITIADIINTANEERDGLRRVIDVELEEQEKEVKKLGEIKGDIGKNKEEFNKEKEALSEDTEMAFNRAAAVAEHLDSLGLDSSNRFVDCQIAWMLSTGGEECSTSEKILISNEHKEELISQYCNYLSRTNSESTMKLNCTNDNGVVGILSRLKRFVSDGIKRLIDVDKPADHLDDISSKVKPIIAELEEARRILVNIQRSRKLAIENVD